MTRVTISLRTGGQGQPTPIHTQRPTQPPFQHRHIHKKLLKCSFSHFSTRGHGPTDGRTDQWTNGPTDQRTNGPTDGRTHKASYRVACPHLKKGTQYRCGWVGRGSRSPSTPKAPPNPSSHQRHMQKELLERSFSHFSTRGHGLRERRTDGWTKPFIELRVRN